MSTLAPNANVTDALPRIVAVAALDAHGLWSTTGLGVSWQELGVAAPGDGRTFRAVFEKPDLTFRRLDRQTRALVLAAQACGLESLLTSAQREETALIVETTCGSLEVDLRYTRSLADGIVQGAIFPYTLQSTCLGDVALRLGLCGPALSLSIAGGEEGEALREARRLLTTGEARLALVGRVDMLDEAQPELELALRAVVALVVAPGEDLPAALPWPEEAGDPFAILAAACTLRRRASPPRPSSGE